MILSAPIEARALIVKVGVFIRLRHERSRICQKEIFHIPGLVPSIAHRIAGVYPHSSSSNFMLHVSTGPNNLVSIIGQRPIRLATHFLDHSCESMLAVYDAFKAG